jgi:hypothetical protein
MEVQNLQTPTQQPPTNPTPQDPPQPEAPTETVQPNTPLSGWQTVSGYHDVNEESGSEKSPKSRLLFFGIISGIFIVVAVLAIAGLRFYASTVFSAKIASLNESTSDIQKRYTELGKTQLELEKMMSAGTFNAEFEKNFEIVQAGLRDISDESNDLQTEFNNNNVPILKSVLFGKQGNMLGSLQENTKKQAEYDKRMYDLTTAILYYTKNTVMISTDYAAAMSAIRNGSTLTAKVNGSASITQKYVDPNFKFQGEDKVKEALPDGYKNMMSGKSLLMAVNSAMQSVKTGSLESFIYSAEKLGSDEENYAKTAEEVAKNVEKEGNELSKKSIEVNQKYLELYDKYHQNKAYKTLVFGEDNWLGKNKYIAGILLEGASQYQSRYEKYPRVQTTDELYQLLMKEKMIEEFGYETQDFKTTITDSNFYFQYNDEYLNEKPTLEYVGKVTYCPIKLA